MNEITRQDQKMSFLRSLKGQLVVFAFLVSIIPLIIVVAISATQANQTITEMADDVLVVSANTQVLSITEWLNSTVRDAETLATLTRVQAMDEKSSGEAIKQYFDQWGTYEAMFLILADGNILYSTDNYKASLADRSYFQEGIKGKTYLFGPVANRATGHMTLIVSAPVKKDGKVVGVIGLTVPTKVMEELLASARNGKTGEAYLVNSDGFAITPLSNLEQLKAAGLVKTMAELELKVDTEGAKAALAKKTGSATYKNYLGNDVVGAYSYLEKTGWGILVEQDVSETYASADRLRMVLLIVPFIVGILAILSGWWIASSLSTPIRIMTGALKSVSRGELTNDIDISVKKKIMGRKDELGLIGQSLKLTEEYFEEMASTAKKIAEGDLTVNFTPRSEKDDLGIAFLKMLNNLRDIIHSVTDSATNLNHASDQLAAASGQAGQASSQISSTIQQVARGTSQQSESVNRTASSVEQLSRAIEGVAQGAQEQAKAVSNASVVSSEISKAVEQVAVNAQQVQNGALEAAQQAKQGAETVEDTLKGMEAIKQKADITNQKVLEMGSRSEQIGAIVETIDDIASQTNLLALNAAIEAARAGEHGKGFAVVADEVRKLAERSSQATKEIGALVRGIQVTISEAVAAMNDSAVQVDQGVQRAASAGDALKRILNTAEKVDQQARMAAEAVEKARKASDQLVTAIDTVSAVVEENTAATEEMAAASSGVSEMIENIASVSEENSAAVEEVSASTEEMTAQVEEVSASANILSEMSTDLQALVNRFVLDQGQKKVRS